MATPNCTELTQQLFTLLQRRDGAAMARLYAADARFGDPIYGELSGDDVGHRLRLITSLIEPRHTLEIVGITPLDADTAHTKWRSFSCLAPGAHTTHNEIITTLLVRGGLIVQQHDSFDFARWAPAAYGLSGRLFGGMAWYQRRSQRRVRAALAAFAKSGVAG